MSPVLSIWLDLCRVLAAFAVFLGHSVGLEVAPRWMSPQWQRSADDAVTVFFIISGLVIAHTTRQRQADGLRSYALARASRVYSVAVPAILFAYVVDQIGMRIDVSQYVPSWQYPRPWLFIPLHLAFLGETWLGAFQPFSMAPYWSLSYEAWYYAFFGAVFFLRGWWRVGVAGAIFLIMGPRIWLLMPIWWLGVWLHGCLGLIRLPAAVARAMMAAAVAGYAAFIELRWQKALDQASKDLYGMFSQHLPFPFSSGSTVHVLSDYAMALLCVVFVVGCAHSRIEIQGRLARLIRWLAARTFTFYLLHFTLLVFSLALGWRHVGAWHFVGITVAVLVITWLHAMIGEDRRRLWARFFDRCLSLLPTPRDARAGRAGTGLSDQA